MHSLLLLGPALPNCTGTDQCYTASDATAAPSPAAVAVLAFAQAVCLLLLLLAPALPCCGRSSCASCKTLPQEAVCT
jgi:hypothetical protein